MTRHPLALLCRSPYSRSMPAQYVKPGATCVPRVPLLAAAPQRAVSHSSTRAATLVRAAAAAPHVDCSMALAGPPRRVGCENAAGRLGRSHDDPRQSATRAGADNVRARASGPGSLYAGAIGTCERCEAAKMRLKRGNESGAVFSMWWDGCGRWAVFTSSRHRLRAAQAAPGVVVLARSPAASFHRHPAARPTWGFRARQHAHAGAPFHGRCRAPQQYSSPGRRAASSVVSACASVSSPAVQWIGAHRKRVCHLYTGGPTCTWYDVRCASPSEMLGELWEPPTQLRLPPASARRWTGSCACVAPGRLACMRRMHSFGRMRRASPPGSCRYRPPGHLHGHWASRAPRGVALVGGGAHLRRFLGGGGAEGRCALPAHRPK